MYLQLSIPVFICNCILVPYALWDIVKQYKHTTLKPRLIMISLMMIANIPSSLLTVLGTLINNGWVENPTGCYIYRAFNFILILKGLSLTTLALLVTLVVSKKYTAVTLNKIGNILCFSILGIFIILQSVVLPLTGIKSFKPFTVAGKTYNRVCGGKSAWFVSGTHYWQMGVSFITLFMSLTMLFYSYYKNRMRKGTSYARICTTFALYSFINFISDTAFILENIFRLKLSEVVKNMLFDIQKIVPSLFALTYIFSESVNVRKPKNLDIKKVLKTYQTRKLFANYLERIGERKMFRILEQWNEIGSSNSEYFSVLDKEGLTKNEALDYIEKHLAIDVFGFCCSDEYIDYFESRRRKGEIDAGLEAELCEVE